MNADEMRDEDIIVVVEMEGAWERKRVGGEGMGEWGGEGEGFGGDEGGFSEEEGGFFYELKSPHACTMVAATPVGQRERDRERGTGEMK